MALSKIANYRQPKGYLQAPCGPASLWGSHPRSSTGRRICMGRCARARNRSLLRVPRSMRCRCRGSGTRSLPTRCIENPRNTVPKVYETQRALDAFKRLGCLLTNRVRSSVLRS